MTPDYTKLRQRILQEFGTQERFAEALGISPASLTQRLNGDVRWTVQELFRACDLLHITVDQAPEFFSATG